MEIKTDTKFKEKIDAYPDFVRDKMKFLRSLIIETAEESGEIEVFEETLKWGEPSFITKDGSTLRMDWKEKTPDQYALYFQCSSRLVDTFRLVFNHKFTFEGKRAILFQLNQQVPIDALKKCIKATLTYHKVKHLQFLGL